MLVVFHEADLADAVRDRDLVADDVAQSPRHVGAKNGLVWRPERAALLEVQQALAAVAEVLEVVRGSPDDAEAAVRVAEGDRYGPGDIGVAGHHPVAPPGHVGRRLADAEDRVEQQVHGPAARADDQVGARDRAGKAFAGLAAHLLDGQQQHHRHADGKHSQAGRDAAAPQALRGQSEEGRHAACRALPA